MKLTRLVPTVVVLFSISGVTAAEPVYSVNVGLDYSNVDTHYGFFSSQPTTTIKEDFSGVGGRIGFGVTVSDAVAFEAGWIRFGDNAATASEVVFCIGPPCPPIITEVEQSGSAFWVAYTPTMRRDKWRLIGKLGLARTEIKTERRSDSTGTKGTTVRPLLGAGAIYQFWENVGLRFDLDWMGGKATTFAVGISYRF